MFKGLEKSAVLFEVFSLLVLIIVCSWRFDKAISEESATSGVGSSGYEAEVGIDNGESLWLQEEDMTYFEKIKVDFDNSKKYVSNPENRPWIIGNICIFFVITIIIDVITALLDDKSKRKRMITRKKELLDAIGELIEKYDAEIRKNEAFDEATYLNTFKELRQFLQKQLPWEELAGMKTEKFLCVPEDRPEYWQWKYNYTVLLGERDILLESLGAVGALTFEKCTEQEKKNCMEQLEKYSDMTVDGRDQKRCAVYSEKCDQYRAAMESDLREARETYERLKALLAAPITCDLYVEWKNYIGGKKARLGKDKYLKGCYRFDDIVITGPNGTKMLREEFEDTLTELVVYGYQGPDGEEGLKLEGKIPFDVKREGDDANLTDRPAILLKGECYYITLRYHGRMMIRVM